jgi:hypothetical protein
MLLCVLPVNNLKASGMPRFSEAQNMSDFFDMYNPGSMMMGLARWYLPKNVHYN